MTTYISLFRGINVGGRNKIRMGELKKVYEELGFKDVVTYIQSGNVMFTSETMDPAQLRTQIEQSVEQTFGFHADVVVRTADELAEIIARNPFHDQPDKKPDWIIVLFLSATPTAEAQADLLKTYTGPEEIFITGREAYIYYCDGIGRSKLSNSLLERRLKTVGTGRNWNTILQLQKMVQG